MAKKKMRLGEIRCYKGRKLKMTAKGARWVKGKCSGGRGALVKSGR